MITKSVQHLPVDGGYWSTGLCLFWSTGGNAYRHATAGGRLRIAPVDTKEGSPVDQSPRRLRGDVARFLITFLIFMDKSCAVFDNMCYSKKDFYLIKLHSH